MVKALTLAELYRPYAVLYPAIAEAARRTRAQAVGLIDLGGTAGLNLVVDRVGITDSDGQMLGDPSARVQVTASVVGQRRIPTTTIPEVLSRIVVGRQPLDVTDPEDARRLSASVSADHPQLVALVNAEIAVAADMGLLLLRGDPVDGLTDAIARVPTDALPVVITTWSLSRVSPGRRLQLVRRLTEAAAHRTVAWVSAEGVGVAPSIPTFGDRPASGHSIIGLAVFGQSDPESPASEALGRCWQRGAMLSWLAGS